MDLARRKRWISYSQDSLDSDRIFGILIGSLGFPSYSESLFFLSLASLIFFEDAYAIFEPSLYHEGEVIPVLLQQKCNCVIIKNLGKSSHKIRIEATGTKEFDRYRLVLSRKEQRETIRITSDETQLLCVLGNNIYFIKSADSWVYGLFYLKLNFVKRNRCHFLQKAGD